MPKQARKKPMGLEKARIFLATEIDKHQQYEALSDEEVAKKLGIGTRTYHDKVKEPWNFSVGELAILIRTLNIPAEIIAAWQKIIIS